MKYSTEERVKIALRRGEALARSRDRRIGRGLSASAGVLFAILVLVICMLPGGASASSPGSVYGAFLLSAEAGGYILSAVIAFLLGVAVTLACMARKKSRSDTRKFDSEDDSEETP